MTSAQPDVHVSFHAVDRWLERVACARPGTSRTRRGEVEDRLRRVVERASRTGQLTPSPPAWTRHARPYPGTLYVGTRFKNRPVCIAVDVRPCGRLVVTTVMTPDTRAAS